MSDTVNHLKSMGFVERVPLLKAHGKEIGGGKSGDSFLRQYERVKVYSPGSSKGFVYVRAGKPRYRLVNGDAVFIGYA